MNAAVNAIAGITANSIADAIVITIARIIDSTTVGTVANALLKTILLASLPA